MQMKQEILNAKALNNILECQNTKKDCQRYFIDTVIWFEENLSDLYRTYPLGLPTLGPLADVALPDVTVVGGPGFVVVLLVVVHPDTGVVHSIAGVKQG